MKLIPMLDLKLEYAYMKSGIDQAIGKCLEHQHWILGPEVKEFEDQMAQYLKVNHCIGISSGTDALVLSLRALAIAKRNKEYFDKTDKIITTPFTFTATGDAILRSGATPVFVDIDPLTYNIDPRKIEEYLNTDSNVIGIVPVHLYGQSCAMDAIMNLAKDNDLFVIEDVAQSLGGMWNDQKLGSVGDAGTFSFFPSKNLGCFGDGGMISTNDAKIDAVVRMLLKHGGKDKYNVEYIGYNARLDTLQAAILLAKFRHIDDLNEKRITLSGIYQKALSDINGLTTPGRNSRARHVFHQYTVRVGNERRDNLQDYLLKNGISSMVYYPFPLHRMKVFENRSVVADPLHEAEKASSEVLSLPIEPLFEPETIRHIAGEVRKYFND